MCNRGFTLIEILIAIAIMAILLAVAIPQFNTMQNKVKIEKQTKELHSAIVSARLSAMQDKRPGAVYLGTNQYVYKVYTSLNDSIPTAWKTVSTVNFPYALNKLVSGPTLNPLDVTSDKIQFDTRGFTDNNMTLVVTPVTYSSGKNCIVVHTARTNLGRMEDAATCAIQ